MRVDTSNALIELSLDASGLDVLRRIPRLSVHLLLEALVHELLHLQSFCDFLGFTPGSLLLSAFFLRVGSEWRNHIAAVLARLLEVVDELNLRSAAEVGALVSAIGSRDLGVEWAHARRRQLALLANEQVVDVLLDLFLKFEVEALHQVRQGLAVVLCTSLVVADVDEDGLHCWQADDLLRVHSTLWDLQAGLPGVEIASSEVEHLFDLVELLGGLRLLYDVLLGGAEDEARARQAHPRDNLLVAWLPLESSIVVVVLVGHSLELEHFHEVFHDSILLCEVVFELDIVLDHLVSSSLDVVQEWARTLLMGQVAVRAVAGVLGAEGVPFGVVSLERRSRARRVLAAGFFQEIEAVL